MLRIILLLLTTSLIFTNGLDSMAAANRVYVGDFTPPAYSVGNSGGSGGYPYYNNYNSFPPTYNNNYHSFPHYGAPSPGMGFQAPPQRGLNEFPDFGSYASITPQQKYNHFGLEPTYGGRAGGVPVEGPLGEPLDVSNYPIPYRSHFDVQHANIGGAALPLYLRNEHLSSYNNPYTSMGIRRPYK